MITEAQIEQGFDWLQQNEIGAAEATASRRYAEEMRKSMKAILMAESDAKTAVERETYAYAHEKYLAHLDEIKRAVLADETFKARRKRVEMMIDFWRSQESSRRAMGRVG